MIVGVTVTRTGISPPQEAVARSALAFMRAIRLHHGDCRRGDATLHTLARKLGIAVEIHPPDKGALRAFCEALPGETVRPEKPYLGRNRDIVDAVGFMLALPENEDGEILRSGTWSTVRYARRVERPGLIVRPSGRVESLLDPNGAPGTLPAPCSMCGAVVAHTLHADHYPAWEPVPHWAPCGAWCFEGRGEALATREGIRQSHRQLDCGTPGCEGGDTSARTRGQT